MQRITSSFSVVIVAIAGACSPAATNSEKQRARAHQPALEAQAIAACECEIARGLGQSPECWKDYKAATRPFRPKGDEMTGMASACSPVSTEIDCMKDAEGEFCITTGYNVNGTDLDEPRLCRQADAQAVEDAINALRDKVGPNSEWDQDKAKQLAEEALAAVRAGKASRRPVASDGCV